MKNKFKYSTIKKYNVLLIVIIIFTVLFTAVVNYLVDPFDIFRVLKMKGFNLIKPCLTKQERMTKIPQLKLLKDNIDIIYVGSSKSGWWLDTDYHSKLTGKKVYSETLSSSSPSETIIMAENCILIHPEIKKVYFGLDFFSFSKKFYNTAINLDRINDVKLTKQELLPLILSLDTFNYSIQTVLKNRKHKKNASNVKNNTNTLNPRAEHYFKSTVKKYTRDYYSDYELDYSVVNDLKKFEKFANSRNVEVVFFVTPSHIVDIINIYEHGLINIYYEFKKMLANNINYYDLSFISKYNTEPVSPEMIYYRDAVHATNLLGKLFAQSFYQKPNDSVLVINNQNVDKYIEEDKLNLEYYLKNNQQTVKQVREWLK